MAPFLDLEKEFLLQLEVPFTLNSVLDKNAMSFLRSWPTKMEVFLQDDVHYVKLPDLSLTPPTPIYPDNRVCVTPVSPRTNSPSPPVLRSQTLVLLQDQEVSEAVRSTGHSQQRSGKTVDLSEVRTKQGGSDSDGSEWGAHWEGKAIPNPPTYSVVATTGLVPKASKPKLYGKTPLLYVAPRLAQ